MTTYDDLLEEVGRLRAEVAARLNEDDYDPAPIIVEYDRVVAERDSYRELLSRMIDPDDCHLDHHGYCQAHHLHSPPCPHERAKELLAQDR